MANKGLIACIGAGTILTAGVVTSILGNSNKPNRLETSLNQPQPAYQNVSYSNQSSVLRYADSRSQPIGEEIDLRGYNSNSTPIRNVQEIIPPPAPTPQGQYNHNQFPPSTIQSDLPPQTQFIGYAQETVPVITQHVHPGYFARAATPWRTFWRWLVGARPCIPPTHRNVYIPDRVHSQIQYQTQLKPLYTSTPQISAPQMIVQPQSQYVLPSPKPCGPVRTMPSPPVPDFK